MSENEEFKIGDWVRWTLPSSGAWCEGTVVDPSGGVTAMAVTRTHNWPAAETAMRDGKHVCPMGRGGRGVIEKLTGENLCLASMCDMPRSGGPCRNCGYPMAYAHPNCVSDALGLHAVYVNGTAMNVIGSSDVEIGTVNVSHLDPTQSRSYVIPCYLKIGDRVEWRPSQGSRWIDLQIVGKVIEILDGRPILEVESVAGPADRVPTLGSALDTSVAPGTMQRMPSASWSDFGGKPPLKLARPIIVPVRQNFVAEELPKISAPALYDGLTRYQCYLRWNTNRAFSERRRPLPYDLTTTQVEIGRLLNQNEESPIWSADLRAKVQASQERDRERLPSVVIEHEVD